MEPHFASAFTGRRAFLAAGIALAVAGGLAVAVRVATSRDGSPRRTLAADTTSTARESRVSGVSAEQQALRNHPPKAGPFPDMTGVIAPKDILHQSGGPYLTPQRAADVVLERFDCRLGGHAGNDANSMCTQVDVRFFDHYSDFWAVEGGQTQFVGA